MSDLLILLAAAAPTCFIGVYVVLGHVIGRQRVSDLYGHGLRGSLKVSVGEHIKKVQIIGNVERTGASSSAHPHISIFLGGAIPIDPSVYLKAKVGL
ncbi:hypothetical protein [Glaciihabitans sp. UYNi722]|uniref:hypothetical protein n=1 Tax=Glaciihabitans sp. UYNi722 TaxID=3156344 RepID=UPI003397EC4A